VYTLFPPSEDIFTRVFFRNAQGSFNGSAHMPVGPLQVTRLWGRLFSEDPSYRNMDNFSPPHLCRLSSLALNITLLPRSADPNLFLSFQRKTTMHTPEPSFLDYLLSARREVAFLDPNQLECKRLIPPPFSQDLRGPPTPSLFLPLLLFSTPAVALKPGLLLGQPFRETPNILPVAENI